MQEKMKIVIYTQRVEVVENYNERRDCADQRISDFIYSCDFLPIPVPNRTNMVGAIVDSLRPSGIILTGGNSLCMYGGNALERDETDRRLIELSIEKRIPLLGFCRGMQSILDYFGCRLENIDGHAAARHLINEEHNSYEVNSYHNQACRRLEENCELYTTAISEDGIIEAIHHKQYAIMGIMWHPEREDDFTQRDIDMVKGFFDQMGE